MSLSYQYFMVLKKVGFVLLFFSVLSLGCEQYTTNQILIELRRTDQGPSFLWLWGGLSLLNGFFSPVMMILITVYAIDEKHQGQRLVSFIKNNLSQTLIETLRAWGKIFFGFIFFFIPGLWMHVRLSFVPFVVLESEEYQNGHKDALEESQRLTRQKLKEILVLLGGFHILIPLLMTQFFDEYRTLWKTPFSSLALSLMDTLFYIFFTLLFYKLYLQTKKENI